MPEKITERYFFALWPDDNTAAKLHRNGELLLPTCRQRLLPIEKLHMTLVYLGELEPSLIENAMDIASQLEFEPFNLEINQFRQWRRIRLLLLTVDEIPEALTGLVHRLQTGLKTIGFEPEMRQFIPHISLARKYSDPNISAQLESVNWQVSNFHLVKSVSTGQQTRYIKVATWPKISI